MAVNNTQDDFKNAQPIALGQVFTSAVARGIQDNDPSVKLTPDDIAFREMYGFRPARVGYTTGEDDDEKARLEEEKTSERALANAAMSIEERNAQQISYHGVKMNYTSFVTGLKSETALDQGLKNINSGYIPVNRDDMLHVDSNGKRIDAKDDPDDKFLVKTKEEKKAFEDKAGLNTKFLSLDEVTKLDDGKIVRTDAFEDTQRLDAKISEQANVLNQLDSGKMKLEDTPDHMKADIAARISGNAPTPLLVGDAEKLRQDLQRDRLGTEFKMVLEGKMDLSTLTPEDQLKLKEMEKVREDQTFKAGLANGVAEFANSTMKPEVAMNFKPGNSLGM